MPWLTKVGMQYGQIPISTGRIFWVAPAAQYSVQGQTFAASNDNDGLSPERALRTINQAVTNATANVGDVIYLLRGTHTVTATQTINKAGLTIIGESGSTYGSPALGAKPRTTLTIRGTADELLNITADDTIFEDLLFQGTATYSIFSFQTTSAINSTVFRNSWVDMDYKSAISTMSRGLDFANRAGGQHKARMGTMQVAGVATAYLEGCMFWSNGANGEAVHLATAHATFRNCRFHNDAGTWATPFQVGANYDNSLVTDCVWTTSGTMTVAISGPHAGYALDVADGLQIQNCRTTGNVGTPATATAKASPFLNFGTTGFDLSQNYASGRNTWADGGNLIDKAN
jgi:hypothetical protein